jgi:hypothetical protein
MKLTQLIGRLASKYPGIMTAPEDSKDAVNLFVPYKFRVQVTAHELVDLNDDQLVELVDERIQETVRCCNA